MTFTKRWSLRREKFCQHFVQCGNLRRAARAAGFHPKYGSDLYQLPEVRARIDELLSENCRQFEQQFAAAAAAGR